MTPVLLDTGVIVALLDKSEQYHKRCVASLAALEAPLITCEAVIAESCYLLRKNKAAPAAVLENVESASFLLPYRLTGRATKLMKLLNKYANVPMGFADGCLVDMAGEFQTGRILTLDRDFLIYRWGTNRPFELLVSL